MEQFVELFSNVANFTWQQLLMIAIGATLIYLAIKKEMEPTLLLPMGFGAILVNLPFVNTEAIETLFNAGIATELFPLLLFIGICIYNRHKKFDGEILAIYLMGYGIGRFFIEGLRTDQLVIKALGGIAASQVLSIVLILLGAVFVIYNRTVIKKTKAEHNSKM